MSNQVHAPYHFVPLSKWVYLPEWAHQVSHDHPFQDGLSGSIEYSLTNKTPLLVGASTSANNSGPSTVKWSRTPDGQPLIPGSSLKGMLRAFLEVATFAKFKQIDDARFAYRDISSADTTYSQNLQNTREKAAWLKYDAQSKQWVHRECSFVKVFNSALNTAFKYDGKKAITNATDETAVAKYEKHPLNRSPLKFDIETKQTQKSNYKYATNLNLGKYEGHVVFTGHRIGKADSLNFSYVFFNATDVVQVIDSKLVNQMFAAHGEELVNYLKNHGHPSFGIPVFMRLTKEVKPKIVAIGLARMPKMLYNKSIQQLASDYQKGANLNDATFDFCELLFGSLRDFGIGLKSRVIFSDAQCQKNTEMILDDNTKVILGQPQASYLNAYIEQDSKRENGDLPDTNELTNYQEKSVLSGWKRYPIQPNFSVQIPDDLKDKVNVQSQLELLKPSAEFKGKIVFHNLKPAELGALLWALNPSKEYYHGLGHAKSLGAGAVQLSAKLSLAYGMHDEYDAEKLKQIFVEHMKEMYRSNSNGTYDWLDSTQIKHLLSFGRENHDDDIDLTYMSLQKNNAGVTYSNSKASGRRKALPNWKQGNKYLSREDQTRAYMEAPQGRLSELFDNLLTDKTLKESLEEVFEKSKRDVEHQQQMQAKQQAQDKIEALKVDASEEFARLLDLAAHYEKYRDNSTVDAENQRTARHAEITKVLEAVVQADHAGASLDELKHIYNVVYDFELTQYFDAQIKAKDLSKKQKERHQQRKLLIEKLASIITL